VVALQGVGFVGIAVVVSLEVFAADEAPHPISTQSIPPIEEHYLLGQLAVSPSWTVIYFAVSES
jgi:hypothetical protein